MSPLCHLTLRKTFYTTKYAYLFSRYRRLITKPGKIRLNMANLIVFGKTSYGKAIYG